MKIPMYQVDAFTTRVFGGNPAAVCLLKAWLDDETLQSIAQENNLSETAYVIPRDGYYDIRWFTPAHEIDLAGHPTLASAWVVFNELAPRTAQIRFRTRRAGELFVTRADRRLVMDFPARPGTSQPITEEATNALGLRPLELYRSRDWMAVLPDEEAVRAYRPDGAALAGLAGEKNGIIITAPGTNVDFVSRFFAPDLGILEDPVTGSAHCTLVPYWSERLGKTVLEARQVSARGGELFLEARGERVTIAGEAALYLTGEICV
ncbi:MAG: PhzF family phenazine biosynthesis protein [Spirochaetota bacterium]